MIRSAAGSFAAPPVIPAQRLPGPDPWPESLSRRGLTPQVHDHAFAIRWDTPLHGHPVPVSLPGVGDDIARCCGERQATASLNRLSASTASTTNATSTTPCTATKGGSDPFGASACNEGTFRNNCTTSTNTFR